ncbi:MAG: monofunctional biosynthetic peptidoglycan transglycosylase [Deltaproteobacteria bacterium]|nr:monofunctional biosynthetic peptidoglycan transglycosylase [Deltaproteobacteria bacterium]
MKKILLFFGLIIALFSVFFPDVLALRRGSVSNTAYMREDEGAKQHHWVPIERISSHLRRAVVVAEDGRFYKHDGVDVDELKASVEKNLKKGEYSRGFSTITMQLARNLYLTRDKAIWRKLAELLITLKLELILPKRRILEIYLNVVEWGDHVYGAEAAAHHYFSKSAAALSASEAAFLASILPSPKKWGHYPPGPYVARRMQKIQRLMGQ